MKNRPATNIYPAIVRDIHDPMKSGRIKVECPALYGIETQSPWCLPAHQTHFWSVPLEGQTVWIQLRDGDARYPVWTGYYTTYATKSSPDDFRALSEGPNKDALRDAVDHTSAYDVNDHQKGHDHNAGEYWNPYWHGLRFPMGAGLGVNEEPGEQGLKVHDRIGQYLEFVGDPTAPLDPHDETRIGGAFDAPDLDNTSVLYTNETWRAKTRLQGRHTNYLEMRVKDIDREEEVELRQSDIADVEGSKLYFSGAKLAKKFQLERFAGSAGRKQGYEAVIDPDNLTIDYQKLYDGLGQEFEIHSDTLSPARWFRLKNGWGDHLRVDWDGRFMEWVDHNAQQIFYNTNEQTLTRHIRIESGSGEVVRIDKDNQYIQLIDRLGNEVKLDVVSNSITLTHSSGAEVVNVSAGGVAVTTAAGMTVNGKNVALDGDVVTTPAGPGNVIGSGK